MVLDFSVVWPYWPFLVQGAWLTLQLSLLGTVGGLVLGLIAALCKMSSAPIISAPASFYVWFIRGTPLLVQLFIVYYGLPQMGIQITAYAAGVFSLAVNAGAYMAEAYRASILAIPRGQMEAALSLGMRPLLALRRVVVPQALKIAVPSLGNQAIILLKDSSLASVIAIPELLMVAKRFASRHFAFLEFFIGAALVYLVLMVIFNYTINLAERKLSVSQRPATATGAPSAKGQGATV